MMERHCAQLSAVSNSRSARVEGVPVAAIPSPPTAAAVEYLPVLSATDCDDPTAYAVASPQKSWSLKPLQLFRRACGTIWYSARTAVAETWRLCGSDNAESAAHRIRTVQFIPQAHRARLVGSRQHGGGSLTCVFAHPAHTDHDPRTANQIQTTNQPGHKPTPNPSNQTSHNPSNQTTLTPPPKEGREPQGLGAFR